MNFWPPGGQTQDNLIKYLFGSSTAELNPEEETLKKNRYEKCSVWCCRPLSGQAIKVFDWSKGIIF